MQELELEEEEYARKVDVWRGEMVDEPTPHTDGGETKEDEWLDQSPLTPCVTAAYARAYGAVADVYGAGADGAGAVGVDTDSIDDDGVDTSSVGVNGAEADRTDVDGVGANGAETNRTDVDSVGANGADADRTGADDSDADRADSDHTNVDNVGADGSDADRADSDRTDVDNVGANGADADRTGADGADADRADADFAEADGVGADGVGANVAVADGVDAGGADTDGIGADGEDADSSGEDGVGVVKSDNASEMTLDEWKAPVRLKAQYNRRKAGEGEDASQLKKMVAFNKKMVLKVKKHSFGYNSEEGNGSYTKLAVTSTGGDEDANGGDEAATGGDEDANGGDEAATGGDEDATGGDDAGSGDEAAAGCDEDDASDDEAATGGDEADGGDEVAAGGDEDADGDDEAGGGDEAADSGERNDGGGGEDEHMQNGDGEDAGGGADPLEKHELAQKEVQETFIATQNERVHVQKELVSQRTFTGMNQGERMKDENDQFWGTMLLGLLYIMYDEPKCVAPVPLSWWQKGPLIELESDRDVVRYGAKDVIYQLPADIYLVRMAAIEGNPEQLVSTFGTKDIKGSSDATGRSDERWYGRSTGCRNGQQRK
uniref:Uncharacterized protein n=1 Tax=Anopheles dirus TaxID=7168 RepID=A0A182NLM7_9DIPT